jgi:cytochrome P450
MADDENHSRQRRTLSHAFSQKALLEQESIIRGYVDLFVSKLEPFAVNGTPANMCDWFSTSPSQSTTVLHLFWFQVI